VTPNSAGAAVGEREGAADGDTVGSSVGEVDGVDVGFVDVGASEGVRVCSVGACVLVNGAREGAQVGLADAGSGTAAVGSSVGEVVGVDVELADGYTGDSVGLRVSVRDSVGEEDGVPVGLVEEGEKVEEGALVGLVVAVGAEDGDHVGENVKQASKAPVCVLMHSVGGDNRFWAHSKAKHSSQKAVLFVPPMASSISSRNRYISLWVVFRIG